MFIDGYDKICKAKGLSPTSVLKEIGISKGVYTNWKATGAEPLNSTKKKIADYLGITVEELMSGDIKKPEAKSPEPKSKDEIRILEIYRQLPAEQKSLAEQLLITLHNNK